MNHGDNNSIIVQGPQRSESPTQSDIRIRSNKKSKLSQSNSKVR